jgi:putative tryptophan/tyrosine transport system substrate-binding protein
MRRRQFLSLVATALASGPDVVLAQSSTPPRIGWLWSGRSSYNPNEVKGFRQGLRDLGYVEGKNIFVEYRFGEGSEERTNVLAAELVELRVDILVAIGYGVGALHKTGTTIPIIAVTDLVDQHLVESLAHPGGTITGIDFFVANLTAKRLALLKEAMPALKQVGVFFNPKYDNNDFNEAEKAAPALGVVVHPYPVQVIEELKPAIARLRSDGIEAIFVTPAPPLIVYQQEVVELALEVKVPAVSEQPEFAQYGGLLSYGPSIFSIAQRQAYYVDRILKGAKAADLPVESPSKLDLVINSKTAKALGLTLPLSLLAQADEVIE